MAAKNLKKCLDLNETWNSGNSTFKNKKWRIQYGVKPYQILPDSEKIGSWFFSDLQFQI